MSMVTSNRTVRFNVDGVERDIPALWLRLQCPCDECRVVVTSERRVVVGLDPAEDAIRAVEQGDGTTTITWGSGHCSVFSDQAISDLQRQAQRRRWSPQHWGEGHEPCEVDHDALLADEEVRRDAFLRYRSEGVLIVRGVPATNGDTPAFMKALKLPLWESPFGRVSDTRMNDKPYNVAETAEALPPHTDLAGFLWPPSGQLLHMLINECPGGDSIVVDGWHVLEGLRQDEPDAFALLATVEVAHRIYDENSETFARAPLVRLGRDGEVAGIRYSNQTLEPVPLDEPCIAEWFEAYAELTRRLHRPKYATTFRLDTEDAYFTHAHRVLHARTEYEPTGQRFLRDVYFEFDNLLGIVDQLTGDIP